MFRMESSGFSIRLAFLIRVALALCNVIYSLFAILVIYHGEPFTFALNIPIYAFIWLHIPAFVFLSLVTLVRVWKKDTNAETLTKEFWLLAISVILLFILMLAVNLAQEPGNSI